MTLNLIESGIYNPSASKSIKIKPKINIITIWKKDMDMITISKIINNKT